MGIDRKAIKESCGIIIGWVPFSSVKNNLSDHQQHHKSFRLIVFPEQKERNPIELMGFRG